LPIPQNEGSPLIGLPRLLLIFAATLHICRPSSRPQPKDAPCRGDRNPQNVENFRNKLTDGSGDQNLSAVSQPNPAVNLRRTHTLFTKVTKSWLSQCAFTASVKLGNCVLYRRLNNQGAAASWHLRDQFACVTVTTFIYFHTRLLAGLY